VTGLLDELEVLCMFSCCSCVAVRCVCLCATEDDQVYGAALCVRAPMCVFTTSSHLVVLAGKGYKGGVRKILKAGSRQQQVERKRRESEWAKLKAAGASDGGMEGGLG
jgi:hypothetical protein